MQQNFTSFPVVFPANKFYLPDTSSRKMHPLSVSYLIRGEIEKIILGVKRESGKDLTLKRIIQSAKLKTDLPQALLNLFVIRNGRRATFTAVYKVFPSNTF